MSDYRDDYDDYELSESATIHEKLYFAIEKRRWGELRRLIREGAKEDLGHYDYKDYPLMFDIIAAGASDTACYWLDRGYPVNARGGRAGITLAHAAAAHDQPDVLLKLIEKGSEINAEDNEGHTPLWEASMYGNIRCARILLDAGVNPDGFEEASEGDEYPAHNTPLSVAKYENIVRLLLGRGASLGINCYSSYIDNPGLGDDDYVSPLSLAAHEGRGGTVEALLEAGADPEFCDGQPLRLLAGSDKYSKWIMRELLKAGAKVAGQSGLESLKAASAAGNLEALRDLLEAGAAPAPEALTIAAKKGKFACAAYLLKKNIGDPLAAIRAAAKAGNEDILFYILGRTPEKGCLGAALHGAIEGARFPLIRELMALGAKPDCRDERGLTPLAKLYELDRRRAIFSCLRHSPEEYAGKWSNGFGRRDLPDDDEPELWLSIIQISEPTR
ncbi:MAG: ankyrin repeat domain-containing protein, partial [Desulfovibrio sp.]|nr:ankyrin repeat domain-containing protein [Desulfovibrio sp.]